MGIRTVGIIVADEYEFLPVEKICEEYGGQTFFDHKDKCLCFKIAPEAQVVAVLCGTGKVNSALAAAALCERYKPAAVINIGLSGALCGVHKNDVVLGMEFHEHDFDLTAIGYEPGIKPQETNVFYSDKRLDAVLARAYEPIKYGVFVTGDSFICSKERKKFIVDLFNANCCDMESAAIAQACYKYDVPFSSLRLMSDDADETAHDSYTQLNEASPDLLVRIIISAFGCE